MKNAEIDRILKAKMLMEKNIRNLIHEQVCKFEKETGLTPSGISVEMLELRYIGEESKGHMVGCVNCDILL